MTLLGAVAGQAATAIENARLYGQLQRQGRRDRAAASVQRQRRRVAERTGSSSSISTIACCAGTAARKTLVGRRARQRARPPTGGAVQPTVRRHARRGAARIAGGHVALSRAARSRRRATQARAARQPRDRAVPDAGRRAGRLDHRASRTSPIARISRSSCGCPRRWRRSACSPPASRTRSTRRSPASRASRRCCSSDPTRTIRRRELLEKIERQTFRAAKIVNSLLNLARPSGGETGPVDVNVVDRRRAVAARASVQDRATSRCASDLEPAPSSCAASSTSCSRCS